MSNILLLANLNCDRVLQLDRPLTTGGRHYYADNGRRLGGGGANTGLGLIYAGHKVALVSQVGNDKTADWLLAEASIQGLDCSLLQRNDLDTPELLLVMTPDGERTIIRPQRPIFTLGPAPDFSQWQVLYINSSAVGCELWAQAALAHTLVIAQLAKDCRPRPCHVLISSKSDIKNHGIDVNNSDELWQYGQQIASHSLRYFIITDGDQGAVAYSEKGSVSVSSIAAQVIDTTGAGDAFASGLIDGLLAKQEIAQAMKTGAEWAAIAVATASSIPGAELQKHLAK
ncbi:PfkB family carbohydrate kinase [Moritella yayanosii]|uniref:Putative carbohydrate kinase, PfkB family n=1 Tax=Moritella yayanosii TaxID=69539 RepID=A0A330LRJ8_9GAMM|nr:PfkB family carbohydrate kinase [Moritella yayanosii]SQD76725.1 putative carbohydrate kinase, PfkB family [Moritella yayanosii]